MGGYSARQVSKLIDLPESRVRSLLRAGLVVPQRGRRGQFVLGFQDIVWLRMAKRLLSSHISSRRVYQALMRVRAQLSPEQPLSAVQLRVEGRDVVMVDGPVRSMVQTGQTVFNFEGEPEPPKIIFLDSERVYCDDAVLAACPSWASWADEINLGCLNHQNGDLESAEAHYRVAAQRDLEDGTAFFNLGVVLEDQGHLNASLEAYAQAIAVDPGYADAYHNIAQVYERMGDNSAALRYWRRYKHLVGFVIK